jgi:predicted HicB family RNase H-like nuclease
MTAPKTKGAHHVAVAPDVHKKLKIMAIGDESSLKDYVDGVLRGWIAGVRFDPKKAGAK